MDRIRVLLVMVMLASVPLIAASRSVIVYDLDDLNNNADFNYLSKSLPKSLLVTLNNEGSFRTMGYDGQGKATDFKTAMLLAEQNKCDTAILGNFIVVGGNIQINLEAVDVRLKRVKIAESVSGKADKEIFDLVDEIVGKMSSRMVKELPKEKDSVKVREKVSVEEIYFSGSRKDQWFFTSLGMMVHSISIKGDTPQLSVDGSTSIPMVGLGYGYKFARLFLFGTPPLFAGLDNSNDKSVHLDNIFMSGIEWIVIKNRLSVYSEINSLEDKFTVMPSGSYSREYSFKAVFFTAGARFAPYKGLSAVLKAGIPLTTWFEYSNADATVKRKARRAVLFYSAVTWRFPGSAGIKAEYLRYSTRNAEDVDPAYNVLNFSVVNNAYTFSFFYEMDF